MNCILIVRLVTYVHFVFGPFTSHEAALLWAANNLEDNDQVAEIFSSILQFPSGENLKLFTDYTVVYGEPKI